MNRCALGISPARIENTMSHTDAPITHSVKQIPAAKPKFTFKMAIHNIPLVLTLIVAIVAAAYAFVLANTHGNLAGWQWTNVALPAAMSFMSAILTAQQAHYGSRARFLQPIFTVGWLYFMFSAAVG